MEGLIFENRGELVSKLRIPDEDTELIRAAFYCRSYPKCLNEFEALNFSTHGEMIKVHFGSKFSKIFGYFHDVPTKASTNKKKKNTHTHTQASKSDHWPSDATPQTRNNDLSVT